MIKRILLAALLLASGTAHAQLYSKFGPVTGVLKGNVSTPQTSAAAASDITNLFTCIADTSHFLNGAGSCTIPAGTGVTSVGLTTPSWYTVTGSPVTGSGTLAITATTGQTANSFLATPNGSTGALSLRTIVGADVPAINLATSGNGGVTGILLGTNGGTSNGFFSVTGPATSLKTFTFPNASATVLTTNAAVTVAQGGTGLATLTAHGVLLGEGTSNVGNVAAMALDTLLQGQGTGSDPAAVSINNCGSGTQALSYSTSTHTFGCQTISTGTGTVTNVATGTGLTGGPITTTGTISIDQTAALSWTGLETFQAGIAATTARPTLTSSTSAIYIGASTGGIAQIGWNDSAGGTDSKLWDMFSDTTTMHGRALNDANSSALEWLTVTRTGVTSIKTFFPQGLYVNTGSTAATSFIIPNADATLYSILGRSQAGPGLQCRWDSGTANRYCDLGAYDNAGVFSSGLKTDGVNLNYKSVLMTPQSGTFTMTYTGFTSPPGLTATYYCAGNMCTLVIPGSAVAASNATTFAGGTLPAGIVPSKTQFFQLPPLCEDNGVIGGFTCTVNIDNSGNITFQKNNSNSGWTNSGQKGVTTNMLITYILN